MTGIYLIYNLLVALGLTGIVAVAATIYWRRRNDALRKEDKARFSADLFREQVASERAMQTAKMHQNLMSRVLTEVQTLQEGIDSLLLLLTTADMTPGQEEWQTAFRMVKEKSTLLADVHTVALEMMYYEKQKRLEKHDDIAVNEFCHDVFESCLPHMKEGVEPQLETALPDDYTVRTNADTLKRILRNLLLNAMKTTTQGSITLTVAENKVKVVFAVSDTAPAIPEEMYGRIFKQLPDVDIHQLLLTLRVRNSKLMARLLGGGLYIDSDSGAGVTVVFSIKR